MKASIGALRRLAPVCALALTLGFGVSGQSQAADFVRATPQRATFLERLIDFLTGGPTDSATVAAMPAAAPQPFSYLQLDPLDIEGAIRTAAGMTGVPQTYLQRTADKESSGDPMAAATTSTARGLYQVVDGTWLELISRYGSKYGLWAEANAIEHDGDGDAFIADAAERQRILDLRFDARVSALMAAELAGENMRILQASLGRAATDDDLYIAHFIGPTEAVRLIAMAARAPGHIAASSFPREASSNEGVFYTASGSPRTCAEVIDRLALG
jgi:hypothetical protein